MTIKRLAPGLYVVTAPSGTSATITQRDDLGGQWIASHDGDRYAYGDPDPTLREAKITARILLGI